jgi:hypothetical protein
MIWPLLGLLNQHLLQTILPSTVSSFMWPALVLICVVKCVSATLAFTAVTIQVSHCVDDEDLGTVNGFGQSLASLARGIGPALGGVLWSLSTSVGFVYFNFIAVVGLWILNLYIARWLPLSLDRMKQSRS